MNIYSYSIFWKNCSCLRATENGNAPDWLLLQYISVTCDFWKWNVSKYTECTGILLCYFHNIPGIKGIQNILHIYYPSISLWYVKIKCIKLFSMYTCVVFSCYTRHNENHEYSAHLLCQYISVTCENEMCQNILNICCCGVFMLYKE